MANFHPNRLDHDDALRACQTANDITRNTSIRPGMTVETALNVVAGSYACNEPSWVDRATFETALRICRNANS